VARPSLADRAASPLSFHSGRNGFTSEAMEGISWKDFRTIWWLERLTIMIGVVLQMRKDGKLRACQLCRPSLPEPDCQGSCSIPR
jgi:hypothetical protein